MPMRTLYTAQVRTVRGREGASRSSDGRLDIQLAPPGSRRVGTNPEQLFAGGWSACFEGALGIAAEETGVALPVDTAIDAEVDLNVDEPEGFSISARLVVNLPSLNREVAQSLIERAHAICPYSKMVRGGIEAAVTLA